jgi:hypothetical protein
MHKKFRFYFTFNLRPRTAGVIIKTVHGRTGLVAGSAGRLLRVCLAGLDTVPEAGFGMASVVLITGLVSGAGPFSGGISRETGL